MDTQFEKNNMPQGSGNRSGNQFKGIIKNLADKSLSDGKDKAGRVLDQSGDLISKGKEMIQEKLGAINAEKAGTFLKANWKPVVGAAALLGSAVFGVVFLVGRAAAKKADL